jgi:Tfp pilus assembly protein PilF
MNNLRAALEQALQFHQSGDLKQAESLYGKILQQHRGQPDALNLLGVMANQVGQPEVAIDLIRQAVAQLPHEADFHGNLAAAY